MAQATTFDFRLRHAKRTAIPLDLMLELAKTISLVCCQLDILKSKRQLKEEQEPNIRISNIEKDLSKTNKSKSKVANKTVLKLVSKVNLDTEFDAYDLKPEVLDLKSQSMTLDPKSLDSDPKSLTLHPKLVTSKPKSFTSNPKSVTSDLNLVMSTFQHVFL
ncbi:hypothetical protein LguiA_001891 [Lonicera macranthoides]